jgi:hypothetical protein
MARKLWSVVLIVILSLFFPWPLACPHIKVGEGRVLQELWTSLRIYVALGVVIGGLILRYLSPENAARERNNEE